MYLTPIYFKVHLLFVGLIATCASRAQDVPTVLEDMAPATAYLSPNTTLDAWYRIYAVDSIQKAMQVTEGNKPAYSSGFTQGLREIRALAVMTQAHKDSVELIQPLPFELFIDTTQDLSLIKKPIWARYLFNDNLMYDKPAHEVNENDTLITHVKAYPVFISNKNTNDTLYLDAQDGSAIMTCEAKNEKGEWQAIEKWNNSWCGNSYHLYTVPPMQAAYTKMLRYGGTFKTLCRLSLSQDGTTIHSNEIYLSVNPNQFFVPEITD